MSFLKKSISALLVLGFSLSAYALDDTAAKLQELENAMRAPAPIGAEAPTKHKTRAIVFDEQPAASTASASAATAGKQDCSNIPADVQTQPVDFAVQFKIGSSEIAPSSEALLIQIAKILSLSPDRCVLVEGHTDSTGNADRNMTLSKARADSVTKFIADKGGLAASRLVPVGKGSTDPLKDLDPRDQKNRRVVFKVVIH